MISLQLILENDRDLCPEKTSHAIYLPFFNRNHRRSRNVYTTVQWPSFPYLKNPTTTSFWTFFVLRMYICYCLTIGRWYHVTSDMFSLSAVMSAQVSRALRFGYLSAPHKHAGPQSPGKQPRATRIQPRDPLRRFRHILGTCGFRQPWRTCRIERRW